jgi:hypothetical protein
VVRHHAAKGPEDRSTIFTPRGLVAAGCPAFSSRLKGKWLIPSLSSWHCCENQLILVRNEPLLRYQIYPHRMVASRSKFPSCVHCQNCAHCTTVSRPHKPTEDSTMCPTSCWYRLVHLVDHWSIAVQVILLFLYSSATREGARVSPATGGISSVGATFVLTSHIALFFQYIKPMSLTSVFSMAEFPLQAIILIGRLSSKLESSQGMTSLLPC